MSEDEREGLRGGWAEIFPSLAKASRTATIKRQLSPGMDQETRTAKRSESTQSRAKFGNEMVKEEHKRGLGLSSSSREPIGRALGTQPKLEAIQDDSARRIEAQGKEVTRDNGKRGWACNVCTFANLADHGRCGELLSRMSLPFGISPTA